MEETLFVSVSLSLSLSPLSISVCIKKCVFFVKGEKIHLITQGNQLIHGIISK